MAGYDDLPYARPAVGGYDDLPSARPAVGSYDDLPVAKPAASRGVTPWKAPENARQPEPVATPAAAPTPTEVAPPTKYSLMGGIKQEPSVTQAAKLLAAAPEPQRVKITEAASPALKKAYEEEVERNKRIPAKELYSNPENFNILSTYANNRLGDYGKQYSGESNQDYVERIASHLRTIPNNIISAGVELDYLMNAKPEDAILAGKAYKLFDKTAGYFSAEGQKGVQPIFDVIKATATDPLTLASLGAGKLASSMFVKQVAKVGLEKAIASRAGAAIASVPLIEGAQGAITNVQEQKIDLTVKKAELKEAKKEYEKLSPEDKSLVLPTLEDAQKEIDAGIDLKQVGLSALIQATFGTLEPALLVKASNKLGKIVGTDTLSDIVQKRKGTTIKEKVLTGDPEKDKVVEATTNILDGRDLLDRQGMVLSSVAEMQVKQKLANTADRLAQDIWKAMPELAPKKDELTYSAVMRTLANLDNIPDDIIQNSFIKGEVDIPSFYKALDEGGITEEEFGAMYGVTKSDAGRQLQSLSVIARLKNIAAKVDPEAAAIIKGMYEPNPVVSVFSTVLGEVRRLSRNIRTSMTVQVSTQVINSLGASAVMTFKAGENAIDSVLFKTGKTLAEKLSGKPVTGSIKDGMAGVVKDTIGSIYYLGDPDMARQVAEETLKDYPVYLNRLGLGGTELAGKDLYGVVRALNTPAVAIDSFFRRLEYSASIERNLRKAGLNLVDLLAQDKPIPVDIMREGVKDALEFTFSAHPTSKLGKGIVDTVEAGDPFTTMFVPFARFLTNATRWTWQHYNPTFAASGMLDWSTGVKMLKNGDDAGYKFLKDGSAKVSKSMVGLLSLKLAYDYRAENQDLPWNEYKDKDNSIKDITNIFPINIPLAISDFGYKVTHGRYKEFGYKELFSAVTGLKTLNLNNPVIDAAIAAVDSYFDGEPVDASYERVKTIAGEFTGSFFNRALVPFGTLSDIYSAFDSNESLPRDIHNIPFRDQDFIPSFKASIQSKVPGFLSAVGLPTKQDLPVAQFPTDINTPSNETAVLKGITGLRIISPPNELEKELKRIGIKPMTVYKPTGNVEVDVPAKKLMAELLPIYITDVIKTFPLYETSDRNQQRVWVLKQVQEVQAKVKERATQLVRLDAAQRKEVSSVDAIAFSKLPAEVKKITAQLYSDQRKVALDEDPDPNRFFIAMEMADIVKKYPLVPISKEKKFAGGGLASKLAADIAAPLASKAMGKSILEQMGEVLAKNKAAKMVAPAGEITPAIKAQMKDAVNASAANMPSKKAMPTPKAAAEEPATPVPAPPEAIPTEMPRSTSKVVSDTEPYFGDIEGEGRFTLPEEAMSAPTSATSSLPPMTEDQFKEALAQQVNAFGFKSVLKKIDSAPEEFAGKLEYNLSKGLNLPPLEVHPLTIPVERQKELIQEFENSVVGDQYDKYLKAKELNDSIPDFDINKPYSWDDTWTPEYTGGKTKAVTTKTDEALGLEEAKPYTVPNNLQKMDVNDTLKNVTSTDVSRRKSLLSSIREQRSKDFPLLLELPVSKNLSDAEDVMAVVQGDFRLANKKEIDLSSPKDIATVSEMAKKAQDRLDALRIEYKDEPPMKLFHGKNESKGVTTRYKTGFQDPQAHGTPHSELGVGGTSFTKDINLNFEKPEFGGTSPKQLIYTEIPYADFVFKQVNMSPLMYDEANLDVIARAINGSDRVVRTLSLPRSHYFKETEEVILETDKLRPEGKATNGALEIKSAKEEAAKRLAGAEDESSNTVGFLKRKEKQGEIASNLFETFEVLKKTGKALNFYKSGAITKEEMKNTLSGYTPDTIAFKAYKEVKDLLNNILEKGSITSVKTGLGQRYHNEVLQLSGAIRVPSTGDIIYTPHLLGETQDLLRKLGHTEKANNIKKLMDNLDSIRSVDSYASDAREILPQIKNVNNIRELTPKFSKGGLGVRTHMRGMHLKW